ncbi:MAG TPA: alpha/beta hydrolase [Burkholderiales bacterium]|nr:alpha/beta hydrolase [Burkholderiales bacterium]
MTKTTLVLLPGLDGTGIFFGPLLAHLPPWIDPVVVTYPTAGPNSYEDLIPVVERAIEPLGKCVILGWSFGGPLALMVTARRPSQVTGVILCASFVTPPHPALAAYRLALITPVVAVVRTIRRLRFCIPGFASKEMRKAKAQTWRRVDARVLAARTRAALGVDARSLLAGCRVPVGYLASPRDDVIPRAMLDEVLAIAPRTQVAEVDGPHMTLFTHPQESAARLAGLLRKADTL